jgi:hypothetical protein
MQGKEWILDYIIDPRNEFRVLILYNDASLRVYDWTDGLLITVSDIFDIANYEQKLSLSDTPKSLTAFGESALLFLASSKLLSCPLPVPTAKSDDESVQLPLKLVREFSSVYVTGAQMVVDSACSMICVTAGKSIQVGICSNEDSKLSLEAASWQEMVLDSNVMCITCQGDTIAAGDSTGVIHLYFDVKTSMMNGKSPTASLVTWHQSPVTSVQLSLNGSLSLYIFSPRRFISHVERRRGRYVNFASSHRKPTICTPPRSTDHLHQPTEIGITLRHNSSQQQNQDYQRC